MHAYLEYFYTRSTSLACITTPMPSAIATMPFLSNFLSVSHPYPHMHTHTRTWRMHVCPYSQKKPYKSNITLTVLCKGSDARARKLERWWVHSASTCSHRNAYLKEDQVWKCMPTHRVLARIKSLWLIRHPSCLYSNCLSLHVHKYDMSVQSPGQIVVAQKYAPTNTLKLHVLKALLSYSYHYYYYITTSEWL